MPPMPTPASRSPAPGACSSARYVRVRAAGGTWSDVVSATTTAGGASGTPPTVNAIGARHVVVGRTLNATVTATPTDGDPILAYACSSAVSASRWTFNTTSGAFSFTPASNDQGAVQFSFTATDKDGASAPVALDVTVCVPQPVSGFTPPTNGAGAASASIATQTGLTYALQYTTNLTENPVLWTQVDAEAGTGGTVTLQDGDPADPQRWYRVVIP